MGNSHERIYDIAGAGNRKVDPATGLLPAIGNTVNVDEASYSNDIGTAQLATVWQDPDFSADQHAFYYTRVIEIPTPRWTTFDARVYGVDLPEGAPAFIQERAYTSPIWYTP